MRWQTVVVTAVYLVAYVLIWISGTYRARRHYLLGRADEVEAHVILETEGLQAWRDLIETQMVEALGRRDAQKMMARLPFPIPDDPGQN